MRRIYRGLRKGSLIKVTIDFFPLDPRVDLLDYRPNGFEWGYDGRGPAQLALAILADCTDDSTALRFHRDFSSRVLVPIEYDDWVIWEDRILTFLNSTA